MNMPVRVSVSLCYSLPGFTFLKSDFVYNLQSLEYIRGSGVYSLHGIICSCNNYCNIM